MPATHRTSLPPRIVVSIRSSQCESSLKGLCSVWAHGDDYLFPPQTLPLGPPESSEVGSHCFWLKFTVIFRVNTYLTKKSQRDIVHL